MGNDVFAWSVRAEPTGQMAQRSLKAQYGDGYRQVSRDGINTRGDTWNLAARGVWGSDTPTCADTGQDVEAIAAFIDEHAGVESFVWTAPDGTTANWDCDGYSIAKDGGKLATLTFTFVRTYSP